MIVLPYLIESVSRMEGDNCDADDLKIFFLAHDNLIRIKSDVEWIGVVRKLIEEQEFSLIIRTLRYLKVQNSDVLENIPLLLLNTLNKVNKHNTNLT